MFQVFWNLYLRECSYLKSINYHFPSTLRFEFMYWRSISLFLAVVFSGINKVLIYLSLLTLLITGYITCPDYNNYVGKYEVNDMYRVGKNIYYKSSVKTNNSHTRSIGHIKNLQYMYTVQEYNQVNSCF